jgi:hypothetical protein
MSDMKGEFSDMKGEISDMKGEITELREDTKGALTNIQRTQTALTSAVTQALKELGVTRTFDVRLSRLEAEVFGSKH